MSFVSMNVLTVTGERADAIVERFAKRPQSVDQRDGFEGFELLRSADGGDKILVVTHWRDRACFDAWFADRAPRSDTGIVDNQELKLFDVVQASPRP